MASSPLPSGQNLKSSNLHVYLSSQQLGMCRCLLSIVIINWFGGDYCWFLLNSGFILTCSWCRSYQVSHEGWSFSTQVRYLFFYMASYRMLPYGCQFTSHDFLILYLESFDTWDKHSMTGQGTRRLTYATSCRSMLVMYSLRHLFGDRGSRWFQSWLAKMGKLWNYFRSQIMSTVALVFAGQCTFTTGSAQESR